MRTFLTIVVVVLLGVAAVAGYVWFAIEKPYGTIPPSGIFVEIPRGASQRTVSRLLANKGVIRNSLAFELYARRHPKRSLQAGEYFFDHALSGKDVYWKLANGDIYQQLFTVKEGDTMLDIANNLGAANYMKAADFLSAANDATQIQDIAPGAKTLEGFLFPAT